MPCPSKAIALTTRFFFCPPPRSRNGKKKALPFLSPSPSSGPLSSSSSHRCSFALFLALAGDGGGGERWRNERRGGRRGAPSEPGPDPRAANKSDHKLFYCALTTLFPPPFLPSFPVCVCAFSEAPSTPPFHREFSLGAGFAGANASLRQRL